MAPLAYIVAAICEIAGCYGFWMVFRLGRPAWWLAGAFAALALFAYSLTLIDTAAAGRAFAAYGGIYIVASLGWLWAVEGLRPDRWDVAGGFVCLLGAAIIVAGPR